MNELEKLRGFAKSYPKQNRRYYRLYEDFLNPKVEGGYIYLIQLGETDHYKIGITRHMDKRLSQLRSKCPIPLKVLYFWWGHDYRSVENFLHKRFADKRVKGEWFQLTSADLLTIVGLLGDSYDIEVDKRN